MIDEHWAAADELNVVSGGVRQGEALIQRFELQVEVKQGRLLVERKAPLVGIGYERDSGVLQHMACAGRSAAQHACLDLARTKQHVLGAQPVEETRVPDRPICLR